MRETREEEQIRKVIIETVISCDTCGKKAKRGHWDSSVYAVENTEVTVTVHHESGKSYPGDHVTEKIRFDICPDCFRNKLVPYLQSLGATAEYKD